MLSGNHAVCCQDCTCDTRGSKRGRRGHRSHPGLRRGRRSRTGLWAIMDRPSCQLLRRTLDTCSVEAIKHVMVQAMPIRAAPRRKKDILIEELMADELMSHKQVARQAERRKWPDKLTTYHFWISLLRLGRPSQVQARPWSICNTPAVDAAVVAA